MDTNQGENKDTASTRTVIASEIDEDCLILEEPETGHRLKWPLDRIPQPFKLGHSLDITLQLQEATTTKKSTPDQDSLRKKLEDLVN